MLMIDTRYLGRVISGDRAIQVGQNFGLAINCLDCGDSVPGNFDRAIVESYARDLAKLRGFRFDCID